MRNRAENIFTYYRGRSERSDQSDVGRQLEDNATAALLKTIGEIGRSDRDPQVAVSILNTLFDARIDKSDVGIDYLTQLDARDIPTEGRDVYLVGLSPSELDLSAITSEDTDREGGIVDGVIEVGEDLTIVLEVKTQGDVLNRSQLERYANELGLSPSEYNTATWTGVAESISRLSGQSQNDPVTDFLLEELFEFIQITTLNRTLAAAHWTEDGECLFNTISLRYQESMNRRTAVANDEQEPPRIQIRFNADGYKPVSFSQSEWEHAVQQFPDEICRGFAEGDFNPFLNLMRAEGRTTLAEVGDDDGVRKTIEVNPDKERITFQSRTPKPNSHYIQRPTIHEQDFERFFKPTEAPATGETPHLSPGTETTRDLFIEGDLEAASPFEISSPTE